MKLRFTGGPWDGVEFDSAYAPDFIRFKSLVEEQELPNVPDLPEKGPDDSEGEDPLRAAVASGGSKSQGPIAYERQKDAGDVAVVVYTLAPGGLPWWESPNLLVE